jgi:hypothetical protein
MPRSGPAILVFHHGTYFLRIRYGNRHQRRSVPSLHRERMRGMTEPVIAYLRTSSAANVRHDSDVSRRERDSDTRQREASGATNRARCSSFATGSRSPKCGASAFSSIFRATCQDSFRRKAPRSPDGTSITLFLPCCLLSVRAFSGTRCIC